jgi:hypothetical protein
VGYSRSGRCSSNGIPGWRTTIHLPPASFTVDGTFVSSNDRVDASTGARVQLAALQEDISGNGVSLNVADVMSSIEIGTTGGVAAGTLTIDAGVSVTESGSFNAPAIVVKGTLNVGTGQYLYDYGTLEIDGSVSVGANATFTQSGAMTGAGNVTIGANATLNQSWP